MNPQTITASALGLARNEAGRRFPHSEDTDALVELRTEIEETLRGGLWDKPWRVYDLQTMTTVEIDYLVESGLMTPAFAEASGEGRGFAVYGDEEASLEINGLDHLRLLGFRSGGELAFLWSLLNRLDDRFETAISYAFDPRWGYLTSSPRHSGSGMRAYATLHLPALLLTGRLASIALEVADHDMGLAALWGGAGGVFQVSNVGPQGRPEEEILGQIGDICRDITERERAVRKKLLRENPLQARDQIGRALGTAKHAWSVPFHEAVNLISAAQVGIELGLVEVPGMSAESAFGLMSRLQPAHVVVDYMDGRTGCLESPEIDERRAHVLREVFEHASARS